MKTITKAFAMAMTLLPAVMSCGNTSQKQETDSESNVEITIPTFNADSAYNYVAAQADFGPRVPNTEAHWQCAAFLTQQLERFGAKVIRQETTLAAWNGTPLRACNIIGAYRPELKKRVLLCTHWDSRPYADNDPDEKNHKTPILGVNDGASGVGVLLEVARQLQTQLPTIGIDIIFFDAEDYGIPQWWNGKYKDHTWCLGSQYWSRHPHTPNYNTRYGILLDMVGGKNATFFYEGYSQRTASSAMKKIWKQARKLGFEQFFIDRLGTEVTDDHIYVNEIARIPCVDIINYDPTSKNSSFGDTWHTIDDDLQHIDRVTLHAVGQTLLDVIYREK
ncbi:MAG: M28 family peptidase [Bacteroidales bacterium]|nr:M28 family peptidase [Bacteroidales bacterium]